MANPRHELLPGMYATIKVRAGKTMRYLTVPRTAVTFNPYGETVYIVEKKGTDKDGKPVSGRPANICYFGTGARRSGGNH